MAALPEDKLIQLEKRFDSIEAAMSSGPAAEEYVRLSKEYAELEPMVKPIQAWRRATDELRSAEELVGSGDREMAEMANAEIAELKPRIAQMESEIRILLLPKDVADQKNVILEIRAGTGGDEAALFAGDLLRMYQRYADLQGWKVELMEESDGDAGGYKEVIAKISGKGAYAKMKYESGVHRVQRVPATEAQGRIHTSAATVAVLPEVEDIDIEIRNEDIRIDTMRSSGAGGQHVNTTIRRCASRIYPPASWSRHRSNRSTRTGRRRWWCCAPGCTRRSATRAIPRAPMRGASRSAPATGPNASEPTISRRGGSPITGSTSRSISSTRSSPATRWTN